MKTIILLAIGLLMTGSAQADQEKVDAELRADLASMRAECARAEEAPSLAPIREKIAFVPANATPRQLADTNRPDAKQQAAIQAWSRETRACEEMKMAGFQKFGGAELAQNYREYLQGSTSAAASLSAGAITFGEFNSLRARTLAATQSRAMQIQARTQGEENQTALQMLTNKAQPAQPFLAPSKPVIGGTQERR